MSRSRTSVATDYCLVWNNRTIFPSSGRVPECHLRAGLFSNEVLQFPHDSNSYVCSSEMELIKIVLHNLRCSIEFVSSGVNFGGGKVNGTWVGILALFAQKKADFIPHVFSYGENRREVTYYDFILPGDDLVTILSHPKSIKSYSPLKIFATFELVIWMCILLSILVCGALHFANARAGLAFSWHHISTVGLNMFAVTLGQGTVMLQGRQTPLFNPIHFYIFAILILRQLFSGELTAVLLANRKLVFDSFAQLGVTEDVRLLLEANSTTHTFLFKKYPHLASKTSLLSFENITSTQSLAKLINSNNVIITDRVYAKMVTQRWAPIGGWHISTEGFATTTTNYPIRKTLTGNGRRLLAQLFRHIYYFGLADRLQQKLETNQLRLNHRRFPDESLSDLIKRARVKHDDTIAVDDRQPSNNLMTAIYIYSIGLGLAIVLFVSELLFPVSH